MTRLMISQHSSNPLELSPRDRLRNQRQARGHFDSSDAIVGYSDHDHSDQEAYRNHVVGVVPGLRLPPQRRQTEKARPLMVDLDEDMESDDELTIESPTVEHASLADETVVVSHAEGSVDDDGVEGADEADKEGPSQQDEEEVSIWLKPKDEREEIWAEIRELEDAVPQLEEDYKIFDRLGTGTFSSVYKAIDLHYHTRWDNSPWHGNHPSSSSAHYQSARHNAPKVFVAIKRIYVTSNPDRIQNEIYLMEQCRGCRHVSQLITAFRQADQVVAIMPYNRNEDFREYYRDLPMEGIKSYFRCLFRALRDVHARGIIHRDVKPANFLFDPRTGVGTLCDFGLACATETASRHSACLHTSGTREHPHGQYLPKNEYDAVSLRQVQKDARERSTLPSDKVGYPANDKRPHSKANRAGTRGFRAPEVLLKCNLQSGAVDVWSAGTILLFFLTRKFPLFQSNDDTEALMEIAAIIGRRKMEKAAIMHARTFATNVPAISQQGTSWREFVEKQNLRLREVSSPDTRYYPYYSAISKESSSAPPSSSSSSSPSRSRVFDGRTSVMTSEERHALDVDNALELLELILQPESTRRATPREILYHPFLADPSGHEDDEFVPHRFGEGICGRDHFVDETEHPCVRIRYEGGHVVKRLVAGEGIAVGKTPCEFHTYYEH